MVSDFVFEKDFKAVFNVSKSMMNVIENGVKIKKHIISTITFSKCNSCMFFNSHDEAALKVCSFCSSKDKTYTKCYSFKRLNYVVKKSNEEYKKISFKNPIVKSSNKVVYETKYLTSLQVKLLLTYYKFASNKGIINEVSKKSLANIINCSVKSIDNCNLLLKKFNFIDFNCNGKNELTVVLPNYFNQHQKEGSGYYVMSKKVYDLLFSISNLHIMRFAIRALRCLDSNMHFKRETVLSFLDIKGLLPYYKTRTHEFMSFIKHLISSLNKGLYAKLDSENAITFLIDMDYDGKSLKKNILDEAETTFNNYYEEHSEILFLNKKNSEVSNIRELGNNDKKEKISCLVSLSMEYGIFKTINAIKELELDDYANTLAHFGGKIRNLIRKNLFTGKKLLKTC